MEFRGTLAVILLVYVTSTLVTSQNYNCRDSTRPAPSSFLQFGKAAGDKVLTGSSVDVKLCVKYPFQGGAYDTAYINADGTVSFLKPFPRSSPSALPQSGASRIPMLAPYWSNIDQNANNGRIYFRQSTTAPTVIQARRLLMTYDYNLARYDMPNFRPSCVLIVTWRNVTFAGGSCTTPVNTFQLVMFTNGRHSFAFYLYGDMAWTSSPLSSTPALVGYASGRSDGNHMLDCSLRECIRSAVKTQSNKGFPGVYGFRLDRNAIENYGCMKSGPLTITDGVGPVLGGKPFELTGLCLFNVRDSDILCKIGARTTPGRRVGYDGANQIYRVRCFPPLALETGPTPVNVSIDRGRTFPFTATYTYVLEDPTFRLVQVDPQQWDVATHQGVLTWNVTSLPATNIVIEFLIIFPINMPNDVSNVTTQGVELARVDTRPGYAKLRIGLPDMRQIPQLTSFGALRAYDRDKKDRTDKAILYTTPEWSHFFFNQWIIELIYRTLNNINFIKTNESDRDWERLRPYLTPSVRQTLGYSPNRTTIARFMADGGLDDFTRAFFKRLCGKWKAADGPPIDFSSLPPVPCTATEARRDPNFTPDPTCKNGRCRYRPNAASCVLAAAPSPQGYGQRACYDRSGRLISPSQRVSTGNSQKYFPVKWFANKFVDDRDHAHCCIFSNTCQTWAELRPAHTCDGYNQGGVPSTPGSYFTPPTTTLPRPTLTISPVSGPIMGGNPIIVSLPVQGARGVMCRVGNVRVTALPVSSNTVQCIAPLSYAVVTVPVKVSVDGGRTYLPETASYRYDPRRTEYTLERVNLPDWEDVLKRPRVRWNRAALDVNRVNLDFVSFFPGNGSNSPPIQQVIPLLRATSSSTGYQLELPLGMPLINKMPTLTTFGALRLYDWNQRDQPSTRVMLWSDPFWSFWFFNQYTVELVYRMKTNQPIQLTTEASDIWRSLQGIFSRVNYIRSRQDVASFIAGGNLNAWFVNQYNGYCINYWAAPEKQNPADFSDLGSVPCTLEQAQKDTRYDADPLCRAGTPCLFRPDAQACYVTNTPSSRNHGQRACYNSSGDLIQPGGTKSAGGAWRWFPTVNWFQHQFFDVRGHMHCCVWGASCNQYALYRPDPSCSGYSNDHGGKSALGKTLSPSSLVAISVAGGLIGFIAVILIVCLGVPTKGPKKSEGTKDRHQRVSIIPMRVMSRDKKQKNKSHERSAKSKKAKPKKERTRNSVSENVYVEPEPYPYVNNKRRSRESSRGRSPRSSGAEYADFSADTDYYNDDSYDRRQRHSHFSNPIATVDSMYSTGSNSNKRDSRVSDRSANSRASDGSRRSNQSRRSNAYRPPDHRDRISEESGDSAGRRKDGHNQQDGGNDSDDEYHNPHDRGYGGNHSGSDNMMF